MKEGFTACIECKYYHHDPDRVYNRCDLHHCNKRADDDCNGYTPVNKGVDEAKIIELEKRIESLERIILRIL